VVVAQSHSVWFRRQTLPACTETAGVAILIHLQLELGEGSSFCQSRLESLTHWSFTDLPSTTTTEQHLRLSTPSIPDQARLSGVWVCAAD
jgi:hypothetical protein